MAVKWNSEKVITKIARGALAGLEIAGEIVATEAVSKVKSPPKSGRVYQKYTPRRTHQASAPGEAPASDLGTLAANISPQPTKATSGGIVKTVNSAADYSASLEFGTANIDPRPFMRPALEEKRKEINAAIEKEIARALSK